MPMNTNDFRALERRLIRTRRIKFRDFQKFRTYYFRHYHKAPDGPLHLQLAGILNRIGTSRNSKLAIAAPRESGKSTIISTEYVIYAICYRIEKFILLVSSTGDRAAESLAHIKQELENNERLRKDFPEVCERGKKPEPGRWSQHEIITKTNIKIAAVSVGQNLRGTRHGEHRPGLVILDDVENNEAVQHEESRFKLKDWFEKAVLKLGHVTTNFVFAGTIHHYGSLLAQYTNPQQAPGWESYIFKSIIRWPDAANEWTTWANIFCEKAEHEGKMGAEAALAYFEANRGKMLAGAEVLWPQNKTIYDLMVMREREGHLSFDSEMQNDPINPRDCCFDTSQFHYWEDEFPDEDSLLKSIKHPMLFAACDPSMGKSTVRGDFSAIIIGVRDGSRGPLYILDADIERRNPHKLIEIILGYAKSRGFRKLAIESNNFQQLVVDELMNRAREMEIHLSVTPLENRTDKIGRIQALEPAFKTGQIRLNRKHRLLMEQLRYFPKGQHDDGPDALEMLFQTAIQGHDWAAVNKGLERLVEGYTTRQRMYNWPWAF